LAGSVGDLKKTLSNVKTRGILGELQLGSILEQILAPEQYEKNVVTVSGTKNPVEFAVKLPGDGKNHVWLPIDSKFPADTYNNLLDAYDSGDSFRIEKCGKLLEDRIMQEAKDINTKYVHVPETTEFAIMFLPTEGLYAEVLRRGLMERLQNKYKVMIAGPTTMAAMLNSLYMGFRTIAVSERANEVINLLGNIKTEFIKYQDAVTKVSNRLSQTSADFENLVGVRTRQLTKQLDKIDSSALVISSEKQKIIDISTFDDIEEDIELPFN
jgi:DNA recombination protein RmuC